MKTESHTFHVAKTFMQTTKSVLKPHRPPPEMTLPHGKRNKCNTAAA